MEEEPRGPLSRQEGTALVVVLLAIVVLLPPTLVLATLAHRWQRQSMDFRDGLSQELAARGAFEEIRARLAGDGVELAVDESRTLQTRAIPGIEAEVRVSRSEDVVITVEGGVLEGLAARGVDLEETGTDPEGRVVYRYRKVEIYWVEVEVSHRPSLAPARLDGVLGRLPDGSFQTLGLSRRRGFQRLGLTERLH